MPIAPPPQTHSKVVAFPEYKLNPKELELRCNRLKGRVQLRVWEVRNRSEKSQPSAVANSLRMAAYTSGMWHQNGDQSASDSAQDIAVRTAYNKRLSQLGCQHFDIDTELDPKKSRVWQIQ